MADDSTQPRRTPKAFISYAWTDDDHRKVVIDLATRLRNDGVDVVLDIWDLKPGQDKYDFMERAAKDPAVSHVLMLCNRLYAEKADKRAGGVGDETQIITSEVYRSTDQEKFVPVILDRDERGEPHLPTYLKARMWIDLSSAQTFPGEYDRLLRMLHGAPEFPKPPLGTVPKYLEEGAATASPLTLMLQRALHGIESEKRWARSAVEEYLEASSKKIAELRAKPSESLKLDAAVMESIAQGKAYRDEFVDLLEALCRADALDSMSGLLEHFFEDLLNGCEHQGAGSWNDAEFDPPRFMTTELFLYATATLLKRGQLLTLSNVLSETYVAKASNGERQKGPYGVFWFSLESISRYRRQHQRSEHASPVGELIKERADRSALPFEEIQQMDFLLHMRGALRPRSGARWWPRTLVYVSSFNSQPLDLFVAPESTRRRDRLAAALDVKDYKEFLEQFSAAMPDRDSRVLNLGNGFGVDLGVLVGLPSRR